MRERSGDQNSGGSGIARESSGAGALRVRVTGARCLRVKDPEAPSLQVFFCLWVGVWGGPAPTSDFSGDSGLRSGAWALHEKVTRAWGLQMTGPEAHSLCVFFLFLWT